MTLYEDVLGRTFTVPDPAAVAALARSYRGIAQEAGDAQAKLSALASPQAWEGWTGQAADTFSQKIGVLPTQLGKACDSYGTVAWALTEYAGQLEPVVSALTTLVNQAADAQSALGCTIAARDRALQQGLDPQATAWDARVAAARADVSSFERRLSALLGELDGLSHQCAARIRQAQAEGIQNNAITGLQVTGLAGEKIGIGAAKAVKDAGVVVKNVGEDLFVEPFTNLERDLKAFADHPSFESFAAVSRDLASALGVVAVVAGLAVPGLNAAVFPVLLGLSLAATAADVGAEVTHEKGAKLSDLGWDALSCATLSMGQILGAGVDREGNLLQNAWGHRDLAQLGDLANGEDARVSATALFSNGVQHTFSLAEISASWSQKAEVVSPFATIRDAVSDWRYAGGDSYTHSPAGAAFQHAGFALHRAGDFHDVWEAQREKGQALWQ